MKHTRFNSALTLAVVFAATLVTVLVARAGGYVGNGGDGIECRKDAANRFEGFYALDYLVTLPTITGDDGLREVTSWNDSQRRILKLLRKNLPALAQSFEHFSKLVYNTSFAHDRVWEPSPFGLIDLDDAKLTSLLPANCKDSAKPKIIQAVIRLYEGFSGTTPGHIVYKYDPNLLAELEKKSPLQVSFLYVHEWLWDISPNVERNRRVNRFLHSKDAEMLTPLEFEAELKGMGLNIPSLQPDEYEDSSCQGYPITEKDIVDYYPGQNVMANLGEVKVTRRERATTCEAHIPDCNLNWRAPRFKAHVIETYPFFLSPTWRSGLPYAPIQLMSPGNHAAERRPLLAGTGEVQCRFVNDPKDNLECSIAVENLNQPFFGERYEQIQDFTRLPVMKARITQECFRMKVVGGYNIDHVGPRGRFQQWNEIEMVISVRAKGGVFLKPRP